MGSHEDGLLAFWSPTLPFRGEPVRLEGYASIVRCPKCPSY